MLTMPLMHRPLLYILALLIALILRLLSERGCATTTGTDCTSSSTCTSMLARSSRVIHICSLLIQMMNYPPPSQYSASASAAGCLYRQVCLCDGWRWSTSVAWIPYLQTAQPEDNWFFLHTGRFLPSVTNTVI